MSKRKWECSELYSSEIDRILQESEDEIDDDIVSTVSSDGWIDVAECADIRNELCEVGSDVDNLISVDNDNSHNIELDQLDVGLDDNDDIQMNIEEVGQGDYVANNNIGEVGLALDNITQPGTSKQILGSSSTNKRGSHRPKVTNMPNRPCEQGKRSKRRKKNLNGNGKMRIMNIQMFHL